MITSHELIVKRNIFYRRFYRVNILIFLVLVFGLLINFNIYKVFKEEKSSPHYFLTNPNGYLIQDIDLKDPFYSTEEIEVWAMSALKQTFDINYANYVPVLNKASRFFNPLGFKGYLKTLKDSRNIKALEKNRYTVVTVFEKPLKVQKKRISSVAGQERFVWLLSGQVSLNYLNADNLENPFVQNLDISLLVLRESFYFHENGVSIGLVIGM